MMTDDDLKALTDSELADLQSRVGQESYRRAVIASAYDQVSNANSTILGSEGLDPGDPWRTPQSAAEAYPLDWVCSHGDVVYVCVSGGTWQEPGAGADWEIVPAEEVETRTAASPEAI